jgi:hypothetical protein
MSFLRPLGYVGLVIVLLIVAMLTLRRQGPKPTAGATTSARAPVLGEAPPEDVDRSPKAAQRYVEQQNCLSECEAAANLCSASQEEGAASGCAAAKRDCTAKCR